MPDADTVQLTGRASHSLPRSSTWLLVAKGMQMGAGFLFWVVAAHSASVSNVGIAAACVSGVMLCTQIGVLGTGSAVIVALGRGEASKPVLDTAFSILVIASILAGSGYLLVTALSGSDALSATYHVGFTALFIAAAVLGTLVICLDQASIALHHTEGAATRYGVGGLAALLAVVLLWRTAGRVDATVLLACWSCGSVGAVLVGLAQLRRWTGYRYSPGLHPRRVRGMLKVGIPNQLLTVTERLSPVLVPILLAHFASPTTTAYWYPAWMMAWVAFNAPISVGMVQFNDLVRHPDRARTIVGQGMLWSFLLGGALAVVIGVGADIFLSLLGGSYADASVTALRILVFGLFPFMVLQAYNAMCRATSRTGEAIILGGVFMCSVSVGTALVGTRGTAAVALVWVGCSSAAGLWASWRLWILMRRRTTDAEEY